MIVKNAPYICFVDKLCFFSPLLSKVLKFGIEVIMVSLYSCCCSSEKKLWLSCKPLQRFCFHISSQSHQLLAEKSIWGCWVLWAFPVHEQCWTFCSFCYQILRSSLDLTREIWLLDSFLHQIGKLGEKLLVFNTVGTRNFFWEEW